MIKNWLVRGDCHGDFSWMANGCLSNYRPEETAIIILGDACFNFYMNNVDANKKRHVNAHGYRIYCVRGNHEARPQDVPGMVQIHDADVYGAVYMEQKYPNIRYFKDWGAYEIGTYHVAVIGGAYSVDKWWRLNRVGVFSELDKDYANYKKTYWFPNEQLSIREQFNAMNELGPGHYDFVFTHTCPISWQPSDLFLNNVSQTEVDRSMELWLEELKEKIDWKIWCFGHYHADRLERPHVEQFFNDIDGLDVIYKRWHDYDNDGLLDWWLIKSPNFYMN